MTNIQIGKEYKLSRHPATPIGKVTNHNVTTQEVTVAWNDTGLLPPVQVYSEWEFLCSFEPATGNLYQGLGIGGSKDCVHTWKEYTGFRHDFEYCTKCDCKRYTE